MLVGKSVSSCAVAFGAVMIAGPVLAADFYGGGGYKDPPPGPAAAYWQGAYIGASFGWAWSAINAGNNTISFPNPGSVPFSQPGTSGMIGGGVLGYNAQAGVFVYGIEVDLGGLDTGVSGTRTDSSTHTTVTVKSNGGFYGDVTGRVGVTLGNALLYGKGGFAFFNGNVHTDIQTTNPTSYFSQDSGAFTGWTVGGGLEYKISHSMSVKAEYQHLDLDNTNFSCCLSSSLNKIDDNITSNTVKVGVNFYLNDLRSPLD
jgi:outer membrane immunogenic protein